MTLIPLLAISLVRSLVMSFAVSPTSTFTAPVKPDSDQRSTARM